MARVMREGVCTMIRVRRNVSVLVALAGLLAACAGGSSQWQRERLTALPRPGDRILGERLIDAQYVVAGRIVDVERAILYEQRDRKSTRLNSSHSSISYAVFCLKKKKKHT